MGIEAELGKLGIEERRSLAKQLVHKLTNAIAPLDIRLQLPHRGAEEPLLKDAHFAVAKIQELVEELRAAGGLESLDQR